MSKSQKKHKLGCTTDYRMFAFHERNRPVRETGRYKKLVASMKKYGSSRPPSIAFPMEGARCLSLTGTAGFTPRPSLAFPSTMSIRPRVARRPSPVRDQQRARGMDDK